MDITFNSAAPSPVDNGRISKRPRSETPGSSSIHPSGRTSVLDGAEADIKRLKEEIKQLRQKLSDTEKRFTNRDEFHRNMRKQIEEMAIEDRTELNSRLQEAEEKIEVLQNEVEERKAEVNELRKALTVAEDSLINNESRIQALLAENAKLKSNIQIPSTSSGFQEDNTKYSEDISTSSLQVSNTTDIKISQIRSITSALDSQTSSSEFELEDQEIQAYIKSEEEILDENEDERNYSTSPRQIDHGNSQDNRSGVTISGVNPDVRVKKETVQINETGVTDEYQQSREKCDWMVQIPNNMPEELLSEAGPSSASLERRISHSQAAAVVAEKQNSEINSLGFTKTVIRGPYSGNNRDSPVAGPSNHHGSSAQPNDQQASSSGNNRDSPVAGPSGHHGSSAQPNDQQASSSGNNRDPPVAGPSSYHGSSAQPNDQQASSSGLPNGDVSLGSNHTNDSPLQSKEGNDSLPPQQNIDELILFPVGSYCCLVSGSFPFVNWKNFYSNRQRTTPSYEKKLTCKKCSSKSDTAQCIQDHVWVQHEKKLFFCPLCYPEKSCILNQRSYISSHVKKYHHHFYNKPQAFIKEAELKYNLKLQPNMSNNWRSRRSKIERLNGVEG